MRFYNTLNTKLADDTADISLRRISITESVLKEYKELIAQFKATDWKALEAEWMDQSIAWKTRLIIILEVIEPRYAIPLLITMAHNAEEEISFRATKALSRFDLKKSGLNEPMLEDIKALLTALDQKYPPSTIDPELALKFKAKIYSQKSLSPNRFFAWSWGNLDINCACDEATTEQINKHLLAGIELARVFGQARRTYICSPTTNEDSKFIKGGTLIKSLTFNIDLRNDSVDATFEAVDNNIVISVGLIAAEDAASRFLRWEYHDPLLNGWHIASADLGQQGSLNLSDCLLF